MAIIIIILIIIIIRPFRQRLVEAEKAASALPKTGLDLLEQLKRALGTGTPVPGALGQLIGQGALRGAPLPTRVPSKASQQAQQPKRTVPPPRVPVVQHAAPAPVVTKPTPVAQPST